MFQKGMKKDKDSHSFVIYLKPFLMWILDKKLLFQWNGMNYRRIVCVGVVTLLLRIKLNTSRYMCKT